MSIEVRNLNKRFGQTVVCDNVNIDSPSGELVALLGPSGSGKTTLLRIIAGLEVPDSGSVLFHGEDATGADVRERQVGFVFQHYALFGHMTIFENIAFGLRVRPRATRPREETIHGTVMDLPGYGYARGGDPAAQEFRRLTEAYFDRPGARALLLLIDSRHPGLESDLDAWAWAQSQPCPAGIIGTKVDKLTRAERTHNARELQSVFEIPVLLVSADTGEGLDELWKMIARLPSQTAA